VDIAADHLIRRRLLWQRKAAAITGELADVAGGNRFFVSLNDAVRKRDRSMSRYVGRHMFGFAAVAFGVIDLVWLQFNNWQQIRVLGNVAHPASLVVFAAVIQLFGGISIQWRRTARVGAFALGALYLIFALLWVPNIIAQPQIYDPWGNFFEQFSLVSGALIVFATVGWSDSESAVRTAWTGYIFFGVCVVSFTFEQLVYLSSTAAFVPKWIPPGQMFWAIMTTIALALAAVALLSRRSALLASRLLTVMLIGFGLLVWLPAPFADPHKLINWAGNAQNLAITGAAWIVADFLCQRRGTAASGISSMRKEGYDSGFGSRRYDRRRSSASTD
jgi:hypothetical protein